MRCAINKILPVINKIKDPLPCHWRETLKLIDISKALEQIHQPDSRKLLDASRRRLVFDEFLLLQLALGLRRIQLRQKNAPVLEADTKAERLKDFQRLLPFQFTDAQ